MALRSLSRTAARDDAAAEVYAAIVANARQPYFYESLGVADTIEGRFDMLLLHAVLVMRRLKSGSPAARDLSQKAFDRMFEDMDGSLREMGVGDLSVGKRVRKMGEMFYGRAAAYGEALDRNDAAALEAAIARNVYPDGGDAEKVKALARYCRAAAVDLDGQEETALLKGKVRFPSPDPAGRAP